MSSSSELFTVVAPAEALDRLNKAFSPTARAEIVDTDDALGRVLAHDLWSPEDLPGFARSVVDGYAVRAEDTFGASPGLPALLSVTAEAPMGREVTTPIRTGEAVLVHTGSMVPPDANAVLMVEHTQRTAAITLHPDSANRATIHHIEAMRAVAPGDNVLSVGEDVRQGDALMQRGHMVRPQDIGGLIALGMLQISVARKPRVGIISTGDEVVSPRQKPAIGQVRDVNSHALAALVKQAGGEPILFGIVPDDLELLLRSAQKARDTCDVVLLSAGSSVSYRDMSLEVIGSLGAPGVLAHGVSVKPGKPTIIAVANGVPVFGLPGNPVSAMVIAKLFVVPTIRRMLGALPLRRTEARARLARNVSSASGREDYVQVRLEQRGNELWADPIFGKSNLIYTMVHADATLCVPLNANGIQAGEWVDVVL